MTAQVDTRPEAGDRLRAPLAGSAVAESHAPISAMNTVANGFSTFAILLLFTMGIPLFVAIVVMGRL